MENPLLPSAESVGHNFTALLSNDPGDALHRGLSTLLYLPLDPMTTRGICIPHSSPSPLYARGTQGLESPSSWPPHGWFLNGFVPQRYIKGVAQESAFLTRAPAVSEAGHLGTTHEALHRPQMSGGQDADMTVLPRDPFGHLPKSFQERCAGWGPRLRRGLRHWLVTSSLSPGPCGNRLHVRVQGARPFPKAHLCGCKQVQTVK